MIRQRRWLVQLLLLAVAAFGMLVMLRSTHWGPGIGGDATIYITSARNLLDGRGLGLIGPRGEFRLLPYFPPFFPLVLSAAGALGLDLVKAAQGLNVLLFGALIWLVGTVTYGVSRSALFALLAALVLLVSPVLIPVYSWAMSEPLALFLGFGGLALLLGFLQNPGRRGLLVASAVLTGLSAATRYSSIAFVGAGALGVLLLDGRRWRARLAQAAAYLAVGILLVALWMAYDLSQTATVSSRSLEAGMAQRLANLWPALHQVFLFWFIPDSWISDPPYPALINTVMMYGLFVVFLVWLALALWRKARRSPAGFSDSEGHLLILLSLFMIAYLAVVAVVYITTYPPITIGSRMLSPVHAADMWLIVALTSQSLKLWPNQRRLQPALVLSLALLIVWYGWRSARIVQQNYELGLGYTSLAWQHSQTIAAVRQLPETTLIVTNEENAVFFLTGHRSYPLAEIYRDRPLETFTAYGEGDLTQDEAQRLFRREGAALVLFDSIYSQLESLYGERTAERVASLVRGLEMSFQGEDGAIYYYPGK